mgnify:CR=1 FL=1
MVKIISGNLLDSKEDYILHQLKMVIKKLLICLLSLLMDMMD